MDSNSEAEYTPEHVRLPIGHVGEIPLFPLEVVLFPHMILPLHIFEERYKEMIDRCVREQLPFGIVLVSGIDDATGRVLTSAIGCTARILRVERLPDGRMNIEVVGEDRFKILDTHEQRSYRSALIESFVDETFSPDELESAAAEVQRLLKDFLMRSLAMMGQQINDFDLPSDPLHLSFIAGCVLPITNPEKQELLSTLDTRDRLNRVRDTLLKEVTRLRRAAETQEQTETVWKRLESDVYDPYMCPN